MSLMLVSVSDIVACLFASRASEIGRRSKYDRLLNSSTVYFNPTTGMKYISIYIYMYIYIYIYVYVYIYIYTTDGVSWFFHCIFAFVPDVSCCIAPHIDPVEAEAASFGAQIPMERPFFSVVQGFYYYSNHFIVAWSSNVIHDMQVQF